MTPIELHLNLQVSTLSVSKVGATGSSKYIFNEISYVETVHDYQIDEAVFEEQMLDVRFRYAFRVKVKTNQLTLIVCESEEDRDQWVRALSLIIDMNKLGLDSSKVNLFAFEYHREKQLQLL